MKFMVLTAVLVRAFSVSAQARPVQKIVCQASGGVQAIQNIVVEPTDLTGQICAISIDQKGGAQYFSSNGSIHDPRILIRSHSSARLGETSVYLERDQDVHGVQSFTINEYRLDHQVGHPIPRRTQMDLRVHCEFMN